MAFLAAKKSDSFHTDEDRFFDYPMLVATKTGPAEVYIQDVETYTAKVGLLERHTLKIAVLRRFPPDGPMPAYDVLYLVEKICIAPSDCDVDWDRMHCATMINLK